MKFQCIVIVGICFSSFQPLVSTHSIPNNEEEPDRYHPTKQFPKTRTTALDREDVGFWAKDAQEHLQSRLETTRNTIEKEAKNTIMFLGDGMGLATVTAARILKGQNAGSTYGGEEAELHMETFPYTALSKTYCVDAQVADSACSATAYLSGVKANIGTMGVNSDVQQSDCVAQMDPANHVSSILAWAQAAGKSTGVVTTTRVTHASPGGTYAHIAHRDWEDDSVIRSYGIDPSTCDDIALQLILREPGKNINVILGGGRKQFINATEPDIEEGTGARLDGKHLINEWINDKKDKNGQYVWSREELLAIDPTKVDNLLGLFNPTHITYQSDPERAGDPSLTEMTDVAIKILSRNPKGFFLFVEGGRIDHAHHENFVQRALLETIEFDNAIKLADDMTKDDETLIVVTSDHSHVMTINGYPPRGNPLLEIGGDDENEVSRPYSTLSYANGPGQTPVDENCEVRNITDDNFDDLEYRPVVMVHIGSETHGGEDVMIFSKGPFAHLLNGVQQQSYIPHVMAYSSCMGLGAKYCNTNTPNMGLSNFQNVYVSLFYSCLLAVVTIAFNRH